MSISYSYTHAYESKLVSGSLFKTANEAAKFDNEAAKKRIGWSASHQWTEDEEEAILHLAEVIKDRRTEAWLAGHYAQEAAETPIAAE